MVVALHAPANYARTLAKLPRNAAIRNRLAKSNSFVHLFVKNRTELEKEIARTCAALEPDGSLWIGYPKGAKTDLTRDKGWESLEKLNMHWLSQIAFDEHWTCFLVQNAPPKAPSLASKDYHANSSKWADPVKKTVRLPEDLAAKFTSNPKAKSAYEALAYTNKKEYVLWIVGAKRAETRMDRLNKTIAKLLAGKKNPAEK